MTRCGFTLPALALPVLSWLWAMMLPHCTLNENVQAQFSILSCTSCVALCGLCLFLDLNFQICKMKQLFLILSKFPPGLALRDPEGRKGMKLNEKKEAFSVSFEPFSSGLVDGSGL